MATVGRRCSAAPVALSSSSNADYGLAVADILLAPGKLTLWLHVVGIRADGYHLIEAEMASIDLADELTFEPGDGLVIIDEVGSGLAVSTGPENLVAKALKAVGRTAQVTLRKRIPAGAGLGGGSSDAAAALRWAGCTDLAVAASIGADVAFCLSGGRALVRGIGEVVLPQRGAVETYTLLIPPLACSTPDVYRAWDRLGGPTSATNDLEAAAIAVVPELARYRDELADATGQVPTLAGSGSTWFVPGAFPGLGRSVVRTTGPG